MSSRVLWQISFSSKGPKEKKKSKLTKAEKEKLKKEEAERKAKEEGSN